MKAPDKIYRNVSPLGIDYSIVPIPYFGGVEYIRKDALLEWAKNEQKKSTTILADDWWQEVINKINSL